MASASGPPIQQCKQDDNAGLQGAPYGYTPFCDNNKDMDGFRFWRTGFWKDHLRGKPYHISALYVIDLVRFRCGACKVAAVSRRCHPCHVLFVRAGGWLSLAMGDHPKMVCSNLSKYFVSLNAPGRLLRLLIVLIHCLILLSSRQTAAGDQLRVIYDNLSKDPNSLSNLDQDLPNYAQHQVRLSAHCNVKPLLDVFTTLQTHGQLLSLRLRTQYTQYTTTDLTVSYVGQLHRGGSLFQGPVLHMPTIICGRNI